MIRSPYVSGIFYPEDPILLKKEIDFYFSKINYSNNRINNQNIQALIVPHAGYQYSGEVASYGFKLIASKKIEKVILIGPSHHFNFSKLCFSPFSYFQTPLGKIPSLTLEDINKLNINLNNIAFESSEIHQIEHCLEVELPFLQRVIKNPFKIIPILVSEINIKFLKEYVNLLDKLLQEKTILIVSSDLSHYLPYEKAVFYDKRTISFILEKDEEKLLKEGEACGLNALYLFLKLAKKRNLNACLLKYLNSGDITKDFSKVVGYTSIAFY